jgi:chemotaxis protein methyltransferase CheR
MRSMRVEPLPAGTEVDGFKDLVRRASGLEIPDPRRAVLEGAIARGVVETGVPDAAALYRRLADPSRGRHDLESFIAALVVGETHFFRGSPQFEALESRILPDVIDRCRSGRRLRLWSAGCASGEEAYSLAILLRRMLPDLDEWDVTILGTDISRAALRKASEGAYGPWSFRGVSGIYDGFFLRRGHEVVVRPEIRAMVEFRYLNLVDDVYPSGLTGTHAMDLILCRNVLMYFAREPARAVVARLHDALAEGGWLVAGYSDLLPEVSDRFGPCTLPPAAAYRKAADRSGSHAAGPAAEKPHGGEARSRQALEPAPAPAAPPAAGMAAYLSAKTHADRGESEAAEKWIAAALVRDPLLAPAHLLQALILQERGHLQAAVEAVRRCVYAEPSWPLGHLALAGLLTRLGQRTRAVKALNTVATLLAGRPPEDAIDEGDGLTVGRSAALVTAYMQVLLLPQDRGAEA